MTDTTQAPPAKGWGELLLAAWTASAPYVTGRVATAIAAVLVAVVAQYKIQALVHAAEATGAELSAAVRMAGAMDEKNARKVDEVASGAAQKCVEAFNAYSKANAKKK